MRCEESGVLGIKRRVQSLLDARNINFSVLNVGMIAMHQNGSAGEEQENEKLRGSGAVWKQFTIDDLRLTV